MVFLPKATVTLGRGLTRSQEEYASYGPTGGSGVQTFFDD